MPPAGLNSHHNAPIPSLRESAMINQDYAAAGAPQSKKMLPLASLVAELSSDRDDAGSGIYDLTEAAIDKLVK